MIFVPIASIKMSSPYAGQHDFEHISELAVIVHMEH